MALFYPHCVPGAIYLLVAVEDDEKFRGYNSFSYVIGFVVLLKRRIHRSNVYSSRVGSGRSYFSKRDT